jgi:hypothetical protein
MIFCIGIARGGAISNAARMHVNSINMNGACHHSGDSVTKVSIMMCLYRNSIVCQDHKTGKTLLSLHCLSEQYSHRAAKIYALVSQNRISGGR